MANQKLPKFKQPAEWQARLDARKREYQGLRMADLARALVRHKRAKQALERKVRARNEHLEALSQLLVDRLEGEELQRINLARGVTVYLADTPFPVVTDRRRVFAWIKQTRQVELLTVHHQTLCGLVRELLRAGKALPPGVSVYLKTAARCRGLRGNGDED